MALTVGAKIVILIHYVMLETISREPCMGARGLGPIRNPDLLHLDINTTLHSTSKFTLLARSCMDYLFVRPLGGHLGR